MKTLGQLVKETQEQMLHAALPHAAAQAQWFVAEMCAVARLDYRLYPDREIDDVLALRIQEGTAKVIQGVPLEYVVGSVVFDGLTLEIGPQALIPRPETEELVQLIVKLWACAFEKEACFLDLGTGSGCLAIALAHRFSSWKAYASDISEPSLELAKRNAQKTGTTVDFRLGSWVDPWIQKDQEFVFDMIVSNPPYIGRSERGLVSSSALANEPEIALFAEEEGLAVYRLLSRELLKITKPGSKVAFEMGFCQSEAVSEFFNTDGWTKGSVFKDLSGHQRFFFVERE